jgi:hypothetical protein
VLALHQITDVPGIELLARIYIMLSEYVYYKDSYMGPNSYICKPVSNLFKEAFLHHVTWLATDLNDLKEP